MNKRRLQISVVLMVLAILALLSFQSVWLYKNYQEEEQVLRIRANALFREAVTQSQALRIQVMDTGMHLKLSGSITAANMIDAVRRRIHDDSLVTIRNIRTTRPSVVFGLRNKVDSARGTTRIRTGADTFHTTYIAVNNFGYDNGWISVMQDSDSTQDSLTTKDIASRFEALLAQEKINLPYRINREQGIIDANFSLRDPKQAGKVSVGLFRPLTFSVDMLNKRSYILGRMFMPILISVLLVGLTIFSFILLLRNFIHQRKLTQLKNEFISNITHELKTPIATVSVAIEALKNFNALHDPQRTQEYLQISGSELQRLSLLVDKVLKLSMFEKQEIDVQREWFDLNELITEVLSSMKLQFEKSQAQVFVKTEGNLLLLKADRLHLASVIYNLLDNALKYSKVNPVVQIGIKDAGENLELTITDNGVGIPAEYQKKVFDKFFRIPAGDTHNVKGYGLGLSYVAHVIRQHQGTIVLESQPGIGSRFIIKLPKDV